MSTARLVAPEVPAWLGSMLPFTRYRVQVGDWAMHVMEQGEGLPVLMVHGNPSWGFIWRKIAQELTGAKLRLIMPDLVGLGLSDHPRDASVHTLPFHVQQLGALVDALGLEQFILVAQDWGGSIGGGVCATRAERVRGVVLLNTVMGPPRVGFKPTAFHRFSQVPLLSDLVFRLANFPARGMSFTQGKRSSISGDVARAYRWPLRDRASNVAPLALARMVPDSQEHPSIPQLRVSEQWVSAFKGPAAIVWGDRDPVLGRAKKRVSHLLPQASVTSTSAGHFLQEEVPVEIARAILEVAAQVS